MNQENQIQALLDVYAEAQQRLDAVVRNTEGEFTLRRAQRARAEIDGIINGLEEAQRVWAQTVLPETYVDRRGEDIDRLAGDLDPYVGEFNLDYGLTDQRRVNIAVQATLSDLQRSTESLKTFYNGWLMRAGVVAGDIPEAPPSLGFEDTDFDREMTKSITAGVAAGETRRDTSKALEELLEGVVDEGGKVAIRCRDGRVRRYDPKKYAELVVRTRTAEIATESTRATMQAADAKYGIEPLYKVSQHAGACDLCKPIEGKVYAEKQGHPKYPWVGTIAIPVHPHCSHRLGTYVELSAADKRLLRRAA